MLTYKFIIAAFAAIFILFAPASNADFITESELRKEVLSSCAQEAGDGLIVSCVTGRSYSYQLYQDSVMTNYGREALESCIYVSSKRAYSSNVAKLACYEDQYKLASESPLPELRYVTYSLSSFSGTWLVYCKRNGDIKKCVSQRRTEYGKFVAAYRVLNEDSSERFITCVNSFQAARYGIEFDKVNLCIGI
tara:strand:- start:544 stop:1119 length:576 start_codon:yes stop_codon:yes gene_type:complete